MKKENNKDNNIKENVNVVKQNETTLNLCFELVLNSVNQN